MRSASFDLTFLVASQPLTTSKFLNKQYLSCLFLEICETMWFNLLYFDKIFAGHAQALARNQKNEVSFVIHNLPVIAKMAAVAKVNFGIYFNYTFVFSKVQIIIPRLVRFFGPQQTALLEKSH